MRSRNHVLCQNLARTKQKKLSHFKLLLAQNSIFKQKKNANALYIRYYYIFGKKHVFFALSVKSTKIKSK